MGLPDFGKALSLREAAGLGLGLLLGFLQGERKLLGALDRSHLEARHGDFGGCIRMGGVLIPGSLCDPP